MKDIVILISIVLILVSCGNIQKPESEKNKFQLKGRLRNAKKGEQLYLEEIVYKGVWEWPHKVDCVTLDSNGEFAFLKVNSPIGFYRLSTSDTNFVLLVLDSAQQVTLNGDARNLGSFLTIEGSPDSKSLWEVNNTANRSCRKMDSIMHSVKTETHSNEADSAYNLEALKLNEYLLDVVTKNSASLVAVAALRQLSPEIRKDGYVDQYKLIDEMLSKKYPGSTQVNSFHESVSYMLKTEIGSPAPEFFFDRPDGKKLGPSSFKEKILLLDFWASWCKPCREENQNMVGIYKKFHPRGLEILSVSLDNDQLKWMEAIAKDKLEWSNVSDLKAWSSEAVKLYSVKFLPQTFLLGKDGKILDKGLKGKELEAKLEELLAK